MLIVLACCTRGGDVQSIKKKKKKNANHSQLASSRVNSNKVIAINNYQLNTNEQKSHQGENKKHFNP